MEPGFAWAPPYVLTPGRPAPGSAYPSMSPHCWPNASGFGRPRRAFLSTLGSAWARARWYGNINPLSIDYASRPRLRSRLTLGGRTFPRNPWTFGGGDSHSSFATHAGIRTRAASTAGSRRRFCGCSTLPYRSRRLDPTSEEEGPSCVAESRSFGTELEPRYIFRAESLDQ